MSGRGVRSLVWGCGRGGGGFTVFVLEILCKHVFLWVCASNCGFPSLHLSLSVSLFSHVISVMMTFSLSRSYCPCTVSDVCTPTSPLFFFPSPTAAVGASQGLSEGLRHEAAQQVRDDQAVRLRVLLGREAHHGLLQQSLGRPGVHIFRFYSTENIYYITQWTGWIFKYKRKKLCRPPSITETE